MLYLVTKPNEVSELDGCDHWSSMEGVPLRRKRKPSGGSSTKKMGTIKRKTSKCHTRSGKPHKNPSHQDVWLSDLLLYSQHFGPIKTTGSQNYTKTYLFTTTKRKRKRRKNLKQRKAIKTLHHKL